MLPNLVEYYRPTTLAAAMRLLARHKVRTVPLAGGTALMPSRDASVHAVVDLGALNLAGIERRERHLHIGAMATLQALASDAAAQTYAKGLLAEAARTCAPRPIRNVATIGGTLVAGGVVSELLLVLLALDAQVEVRATRRRSLALDLFLDAPRAHLGAGIITRVTHSLLEGPLGAALERVARTPNDMAIVNAVGLVVRAGDVCKHVRLALGGVASRVIRAPAVEAELEGHSWDAARVARATAEFALSLAPPTDSRGSGDYRRAMVLVAAQRALERAWARAQEG